MIGIMSSCSGARSFVSFDVALSQPSVQDSLEIITRTTRIDQVLFSIVRSPKARSTIPSTWNTFPGSWVTRYMRQSYILCDPVAHAALTRDEPFFRSDLKLDGKSRRYMEDAVRHGIGPCGYTIPQVKDGTRAILSVTSKTLQEADWRYYIEAIQPELHEFARSIYSRAMHELELETTLPYHKAFAAKQDFAV